MSTPDLAISSLAVVCVALIIAGTIVLLRVADRARLVSPPKDKP